MVRPRPLFKDYLMGYALHRHIQAVLKQAGIYFTDYSASPVQFVSVDWESSGQVNSQRQRFANPTLRFTISSTLTLEEVEEAFAPYKAESHENFRFTIPLTDLQALPDSLAFLAGLDLVEPLTPIWRVRKGYFKVVSMSE
jgi:hypothetical protein